MAGKDASLLEPLVEKLKLWGPLDAEDINAINAVPSSIRRLRKGSFITREGDTPEVCALLCSGFAIRHKYSGDGARQIFSIHMRGDMVDLHNALLNWSDHNVQALTDIEIALIPVSAIRGLVMERPQIGRPLWYETLVDGSVFREWALNIGRRDARTRLAHVLCEFG